MTKSRILVVDLEFKASQNYKGDLRIYPGYIICASIKELGKNKITTLSALSHPGSKITDDKRLVRAIGDEVRDGFMFIGHNVHRCDLKFLQTKLKQYKFDPIPMPYTFVDTLKVVRQVLSLKSNSLAAVAQFLGLPEQKMPITETEWQDAFIGDPKTLRKVENRCESDVRLAEMVYNEIKPLIPAHPRNPNSSELKVSLNSSCNWCGSNRLRSLGWRATQKGLVHRYICLGCNIAGGQAAKEKK